jgi:adenylylsulfate kinase
MLSKFISDQGVHVVAAVLSIFPEWQLWNRQNISDYAEVYIKASMETLMKRDTKKLYKRAASGDMPNVVGVDIPFPEPTNPDLIIENDIDRSDFVELIDKIIDIDRVRKALERE